MLNRWSTLICTRAEVLNSAKQSLHWYRESDWWLILTFCPGECLLGTAWGTWPEKPRRKWRWTSWKLLALFSQTLSHLFRNHILVLPASSVSARFVTIMLRFSLLSALLWTSLAQAQTGNTSPPTQCLSDTPNVNATRLSRNYGILIFPGFEPLDVNGSLKCYQHSHASIKSTFSS